MSKTSDIAIYQKDLFTARGDLEARYPAYMVEKVLRVREMYSWLLANPDATDKQFIAQLTSHHDISKVTAYDDLYIVKALLPTLSQASRSFHRWRYTEMILDTYQKAKAKGDFKTMEKAATSYAKFHGIDREDDDANGVGKLMVQPFTATDDPTVLGIKPIPELRKKIDALLSKYKAESMDIEDVDFEDVDLEMDKIFPIDGDGTGS
ncbi:MAG: hypothetical protein ACI30W_03265 [Muribaculaceae bacterium]